MIALLANPKYTGMWLGAAQLISWGTSFFLIAAFGELIAADMGWSREAVYGGFSVALAAMALFSGLSGKLIDRYGGRGMMSLGALLNSAGCITLASMHGFTAYYIGWVFLGLGMRLTLYDAGFAALARAGGPGARGQMAQITLLGGLGSTIFWPVGSLLAEALGWRGAVFVYAAVTLLAIPPHFALPRTRYAEPVPDAAPPAGPPPIKSAAPLAASGRERLIAAMLYGLIMALVNFLNAGMSAHMIAIIGGLGLGAAVAVGLSTLRGIGQTVARLGEVLLWRRVHPLMLNLCAAAVLPLCFIAGLAGGADWRTAALFAFFYGAGNGLLTITRGTLPLALFDHRTYGHFVGRLIAPSFVLAASAPLAYAAAISKWGATGALILSAGAAIIAVAAAMALKAMFRQRIA